MAYGEESVVIDSSTKELPPHETLIECGRGSYGLGNRFSINWDAFYECLEIYGWDMQDFEGPIDNKIRSIVRKAVREGDIS